MFQNGIGASRGRKHNFRRGKLQSKSDSDKYSDHDSSKKGFFSDSFNMKKEIPLEQIEEACVEPSDDFGWSSTMLKMKNGESFSLGLKLPNSESFAADFGGEGLAGMHQRFKAINDSWVNAINSQLGAKIEADL